MKVRLIKAGVSSPDKKDKQRSVEVPIIDTIRSWVQDFRSRKANRSRLEFRRINGPVKG
jgi:hypothetical protein